MYALSERKKKTQEHHSRRQKNLSEAVHYLKLDEIYGRVHEMMPGISNEGAWRIQEDPVQKREDKTLRGGLSASELS